MLPLHEIWKRLRVDHLYVVFCKRGTTTPVMIATADAYTGQFRPGRSAVQSEYAQMVSHLRNDGVLDLRAHDAAYVVIEDNMDGMRWSALSNMVRSGHPTDLPGDTCTWPADRQPNTPVLPLADFAPTSDAKDAIKAHVLDHFPAHLVSAHLHHRHLVELAQDQIDATSKLEQQMAGVITGMNAQLRSSDTPPERKSQISQDLPQVTAKHARIKAILGKAKTDRTARDGKGNAVALAHAQFLHDYDEHVKPTRTVPTALAAIEEIAGLSADGFNNPTHDDFWGLRGLTMPVYHTRLRKWLPDPVVGALDALRDVHHESVAGRSYTRFPEDDVVKHLARRHEISGLELIDG